VQLPGWPVGPANRASALSESRADASRKGESGVIDVWTETDVQIPKNRQQPDNDNKSSAAAGTTILRLIGGLLQVDSPSFGN
jgi:hypothetical protein